MDAELEEEVVSALIEAAVALELYAQCNRQVKAPKWFDRDRFLFASRRLNAVTLRVMSERGVSLGALVREAMGR